MLSKRERVETVYRLEKADRIPFVPAVYEHKARLIGRTPSQVCRDPELLHRALLRELEVYDPDMLVVGIDVYNVEAEALGCQVRYFEDSSDVPAVISRVLDSPDGLERLAVPDPQTDGRMPLFVEVAGALARELGGGMIIRGAVSGPFSIASELLGAERFLVAAIEEPDFARRLLQFAGRVTAAFGAAFLARGAEVILFDSRATPRLSSPRVFRELLLPVYRDEVMPGLRAAGARYLPLIIGANTTPVLEELIQTGATQLLCDFDADIPRFRRRCAEAGLPWRLNVDPRLLARGPRNAIRDSVRRALEPVADAPGLLLGTGVIAYDCDPENVLEVRRALDPVV